MNVKRITPSCSSGDRAAIPFWVDRLGFAKTIEVPTANKSVCHFSKGQRRSDVQTYASVEKDAPKEVSVTAGKAPRISTWKWTNLDAVLTAMKDVKIVMPLRTVFYGMREFSVQDPGGHFITLLNPSPRRSTSACVSVSQTCPSTVARYLSSYQWRYRYNWL